MPRASRCFLPGYVWHLTHRCHDREFLLKAARDRDLWRRWLWEATSRYGLSVLDFVATSNHIHLLVHDESGEGVIARSMQLVQGRTAQSYNWFRGRRGGYWQDRYHAVAVESGEHLWRCLVYIELNMVRCGVVEHPRQWPWVGFQEIMGRRSRYRLIDLERLCWRVGTTNLGELRKNLEVSLAETIAQDRVKRESCWTESLAVGSQSFVEKIQPRMLSRRQTEVTETGSGIWILKETPPAYGQKTGAKIHAKTNS